MKVSPFVVWFIWRRYLYIDNISSVECKCICMRSTGELILTGYTDVLGKIFVLLPVCLRVCNVQINPLNPELNPICYLLALLAHHFLHVSRIRVKSLTLRLLMSYIYINIYIYIYIWSTYS